MQASFSIVTPEMRKIFEDYLNKISKSGKLLINATIWAEYLQYLADSDTKILKRDKIESK